MRVFIYNQLSGDSILNTLGIDADHTFTEHDRDTPIVRPLLIIKLGIVIPAPFEHSPVNQREAQFWVHDKGNDYTLIDTALTRIKEIVKTWVGVQASPGRYISSVEWGGTSPDQRDDEAQTINRYCSYKITGSAVV